MSEPLPPGIPADHIAHPEKLTGSEADQIMAQLIAKMLKTCRFPLENEKATQAYISQTLTGLGIDHIREQRLSDTDIVDFWLPSKSDAGAIIEVKMNAARPPQVLKQLERYAEHESVRVIFLISNKAMNIPATLGGKPVYCFSLGRAWL